MSAGPPSGDHPSASLGIGAFGWAVAVFGAVVVTVWAGAALAASVTGHAGAVRMDVAGDALVRLPSHLAEPAAAWPSPADAFLPGPVLYWVCQTVVVAAFGAAGYGFWRLWRFVGSDRPRPFGVDAEAGFAQRRKDLARVAVAEPTAGRVTVGRCGRHLVATEIDASLAVIGPSGCGKTAGFAIPALLEWSGPVIATSVKADLIDATIAHRSTCDTRVWVYDPTGCTGLPSARWSPLQACRTWAGAMRMAAWMAEAAQPRNDTVADADYWYSQARKGLAPYLHAAAVTRQSMATVIRWIDTQEEDAVATALHTAARVDPETGEMRTATPGARLDKLRHQSIEIARDLYRQHGDADLANQPFEKWPPAWRDKVEGAVQCEWLLENGGALPADPFAPLNAARALWGKEPRLKGSVFATIENVLSGWADPAVTASAEADGPNIIDLDAWLAGDNTIYVVATPHEQARLRPVLTVLIQQAVRRAYDVAAANKGRLNLPALVLLDEAGNIAPLRDLPAYASTARSHGITLVTVWQDLAQIKAIYSDRARTVLNNHRAKLFGSGIADAETLDYVSKLLGDEARTERNLSTDLAGDRRSVSEHRTYRRAAAADVVRRIPAGDGVLIYGAELPAHVQLRPWFEDPELARRGATAKPTLEPAVEEV